ncbi:endo-1,4-beta-xylanase [Gracilibacillus halotolerans]|uniref:Beta-xylanase n=1 Tax=Gracilibacillus halotolerans TaxID=74386 RepID=A0A841RP60_9BACI|nr:endo-1,4-beta-xylanase [Gracilibacillus halotolerans]MBB6512448.1 endo-1,4-beta-xylanase [Gracilibacillus halotolerans]
MVKKMKKFMIMLMAALLLLPPGWGSPIVKAAEKQDIPVLLYHQVVDNPSDTWTHTSTELFRQTVQYLQDNNFTTLTADQYVKIMDGEEQAPENPILLTFDDATPDFVHTVVPILDEFNMNAIQFVTTDWIGGNFSMSEENLKSLVGKDNISLQVHSTTHDGDIWGSDGSVQSGITAEQAQEQIGNAVDYLKELTGENPTLMAYPYGSYNDIAKEVNKDNGIKYAFKVGYPNDGDYAMGRHYVTMDTTLTDIAGWIDGPTPETPSTEEPEEPVEEDGNVVFSQSFEDDDLGNWQNLPWAESNGIFEISTEQASDGSKSLLFKDREDRNSSPSLNLTDKVEPGYNYNISLKVRVSEGTDTLRIASKVDAPSLDNNYPWVVDNQDVSSTDWTSFEANEFSLPTDTSEFILYVESDDSGSETAPNIFIDEVIITQLGEIDSTPGDENGEEEDPDREPALEFETITFEDGELNGFEARGENELLTVTDEANHTEDGSFALKVENREQAWNGPSLRVEEYINIGEEYKISAWIKLISPDSSQIQLSTQIGDGDGASYNTIQGKTISKDDGWVKFEGTYRYTSSGNGHITIYVESSNNADATFYVDDVTFEPTGTGEVSFDDSLTAIKDVYKDDFLIGNIVSEKDLEGMRLDFLKHHHEVVTAENAMKPDYAYNDEGDFDFTSERALVDSVLANDLQMVGHVLVWHSQSPEWLWADSDGNPLSRDEALANMEAHIRAAVEAFGDDVIAWDVVNEAMSDNPPNPSDWRASLRRSGWFHAIGPDFVEQAFRITKEVMQENGWDDVKLYYNDYNDDNQNKAEAIYQMVKEINENYAAENNGDVLVDGIGMQGHYNINTNPENVRSSIEKFISLDGVEVSVTELDIMAGDGGVQTEQQANRQAYLYAQLFQIYKEYADDIARVTFWALDDGTSWRSENSPSLFDKDFQAKPAYYAVIDPEGFIEDYDPEVIEANKGNAVQGTPTIDGVMDDVWSNAPALPINRYQTAHNGANGNARVLWDDENLYVFVQVSDSNLDKAHADAHEQDSVEVFVDEQNTKASSYVDGVGQYRVNFDNETSFNPTAVEEGFESATQITGGGYTVELKIPFKTINPEDNLQIGFDVQINDAVEGARNSVATWNDTSGQGYQDPSVFGVLTLVNSLDEPQPEPENPKPEDPKPEEPKPADPKPEDPKQPEKPENKPVVTKPSVKDKVATVDNKAVDSVPKNGNLVLDLSDNDSTVKVTLTKEQVSKLKEQNAEITVEKEDVTLAIPASILNNGEAVEIVVERMQDIDEALSAVYDFTITQDGKIISNFKDTPVTLTFPVNADRVNDPTNVKVFYWNPETEEWEQVGDGGYYQDGFITVETDHFSIFTVFEVEDVEEVEDLPDSTPIESDSTTPEDDESSKDGETLPDTATSTYNFLLAGLAMLAAGSLVFFVRRKKA